MKFNKKRIIIIIICMIIIAATAYCAYWLTYNGSGNVKMSNGYLH